MQRHTDFPQLLLHLAPLRKAKVISPRLCEELTRFSKGIEGDPNSENQEIYWEYANSDCTDNFALRVLTNSSDCVNGADTSIECLNGAKDLLRRFTFILDAACFDESVIALGKELDLEWESKTKLRKAVPRSSSRVRISNDTLYEFLENRFRRDIELYEWSKSLSVLKC